ncbi:MAG: hypothetical protein AAGK01_08105, partial [Pseudomonadota bacterium]
MGRKVNKIGDLSADLDIELVSALYRAAGEPDAFEDLVRALQSRYEADASDDAETMRSAVVKQLDTINSIIADQGVTLSQDPLERAVEEVPTAAVVIDPFGRVILTNELGQNLFAARPGEKFNRDLVDPAYRRQFSDFVASARLNGNQRRIILRLDTSKNETDASAYAPVELAEAMYPDAPQRPVYLVGRRTRGQSRTRRQSDQTLRPIALQLTASMEFPSYGAQYSPDPAARFRRSS